MRLDQQFRSIPDMVVQHAAQFGDRTAVIDERGSLTYAQLGDEVLQVMRAAKYLGIESGERVAIWAPNSTRWVVAAVGLLGAGAVLVPLNTRFKGRELADVLTDSGARAVFAHRQLFGVDFVAEVAGAAPELLQSRDLVLMSGEVHGLGRSWEEFLELGSTVDPAPTMLPVEGHSLADLLYTSGTSGMPKGVPITHGQSLRAFDYFSEVMEYGPEDVVLVIPPFFHAFGYKAGWMSALARGSTVLTQERFDVNQAFDAIERHRVTVLLGPPTLFHALLDNPERSRHDLSSIRAACPSATHVPEVLVERLRAEIGIGHVITGYGLTEATAHVSLTTASDSPGDIARTVGRACRDVEVVVIDENGSQVPTGTRGEILVRGYNVMAGYWNRPAETADVLDADGWLHTGDVGQLDDRGYLRIVDRLKDMYVVNGFNVYPAEVEAAMCEHPAIGEAAVIGVPDDATGERGVAYLVPATPGESIDLQAVDEWCRARLANFKVPHRFVVTSTLPRTASGKVRKSELTHDDSPNARGEGAEGMWRR